MRPYLLDMASSLGVHIFEYEYHGYGPTKGMPSDMEVIFDAIAAYDQLTKNMKFKC